VKIILALVALFLFVALMGLAYTTFLEGWRAAKYEGWGDPEPWFLFALAGLFAIISLLVFLLGVFLWLAY